MAMIKCPHCGATISETSKACIFCGTLLGEEEISVAITSAKEEQRERLAKKVEERHEKEEVESEGLKLQAIKNMANVSSKGSAMDKLKKWKKESLATGGQKYDKFAIKNAKKPSGAIYLLMSLGLLLCIALTMVSMVLGESVGADEDIVNIYCIIYPLIMALSAFLMWYPMYKTSAYEHRDIYSNDALIRYIKKEKLDMKEDVRKCLLNWSDVDKEFITNWIYVNKPSSRFLFKLSCVLSLFVMPIFFAVGLTCLLGGLGFFGFFNVEIWGIGKGYNFGIACVIVGAVCIVLGIIIYVYATITKRIVDITIFNFLKDSFPKEYPDSNATYIYGFVKTTRTVVNTKMKQVPTGEITADGKPIMKTVTVKESIENPIPGIKRKSVALMLCIFLGGFGAHHFYNGRTMKGILAIFTLNFLGLDWIGDLITLIFFTPRYYIPQK